MGDSLAVVLEDRRVEIWSLASGELRALFQPVPETTFAEVNETVPLALRWSLFDFLPTRPPRIALSRDETTLLVAAPFHFRFFDTDTGERARDDVLIRFGFDDESVENWTASLLVGLSDEGREAYGSSFLAGFAVDLDSSDIAFAADPLDVAIGQNPVVAMDLEHGIFMTRSGVAWQVHGATRPNSSGG